MELGGFLGKLKRENKVEPKKFLALVLTDEVVQAAVWHVVGEQTEIVALGNPVDWNGDTGTSNELVVACDATISSAIEGLTTEPNEVILGVPNSWTDKVGILGSKKELIKKIHQELELKILGYVPLMGSILSYLKLQEGTPSTSILIQVSRDELTLALVRLGRIEGMETLGRSDDVVADVTEGIARFKANDNLPSRLVLFNSMHNLDDIIQNLLSVDWQADFNFLHIPKIEALPKDVAIRAVSVAGGGEVAKSLGFTLSEDRVIKEDSTLPNELVSAQSIGFTESDTQAKTEPSFVDPDDDPVIPTSPTQTTTVSVTKENRHFVIPTITLPKIHLPKFKFNLGEIQSHWYIIGGCLIALAAFVFWLVWVLPRAEVTIHVTPKSLEQTVALTLSTTTSSVDLGSSTVPATLESLSQSGEKTIDTTGKKIVGDPAKGDLIVYNKTSLTKTLTKGTTVAAGNLKFSLDEDVTIASSSSNTEGITFGKNTVAVTANAIGTDGNLPGGTEFSIMSFSKDSYVGKNETAFAGGTSEEIQVVSKDDQKTLAKSLTEEILGNLSASSTPSTGGTGTYLITSSAKLTTENYSAKVGDKAKSLTGNFVLSASFLHYQTQDVTTLVNSIIDQSIPVGYVRTNLPSTVDLSVDSVSDAGDTIKGSAKITISLVPTVDLNTISASLKGKNTVAIENILRATIPGFQDAKVQITPLWLPPRFKSMPSNSKNIHLTLAPIAL